MARKHRRAVQQPLSNVERLANGGARRVTRRGSEWFVRDISASRAEKAYRCPGCGLDIPAGQAHVVAWSAEHMFGDDAAVSDRRHWHQHCWRLP